MRTRFIVAFVFCCGCAAAVFAQAPKQTPPPPMPAAQQPSAPQPSGASQPAPAASVPEAYTYTPEGRRDPFISLIGTGAEPRIASRKGEGAAGLSFNEISVRGVLQSKGSLVAMVQGPDNKTYIVHAGDKLVDGMIKSVTPQGLVVLQEVNDPLSLVKQREVRKLLHSNEDAKE